jgi:tetratricopeptide (TPR) repeat protein
MDERKTTTFARTTFLAVLAAASLFAACGDRPVQHASFTTDSDTLAWETISLLGDTLFPLPVDPAIRHRHDSLLQVALADYLADSLDLHNIIWLGRRLAYLHRYRDAVRVYTIGLRHHPDAPELYRHRGHRYITLRDFSAAQRDLEKAAALADGRPLAIEPDGIPNKLGIPLSNLHFNIWYHLGLVHFLEGNNAAAEDAFAACMRYADNPDLVVAVTDWRYLARRRMGDAAGAARLLDSIHADMEIIENADYLRRLLLYKTGTMPAAGADSDATGRATRGYGMSCLYAVEGRAAEAASIRRAILADGFWPAFGHIAAEADSARLVRTQ